MPVIDASFLTQRKWQALIGVLVLIGLYFIFRPERDPAEVIRENLYSWAAQLEKSPAAAAGDTGANARDAATTSSAGLLEEAGQMRRLVNSAFTEDAQIQAVRGPREQGRDAIAKWCLALRHHADRITIQLDDVVVHFDAEVPKQANASLLVHISADYQGQRYARSYQCELQLQRDKTWRIATLTAQQTTRPQLESNHGEI